MKQANQIGILIDLQLACIQDLSTVVLVEMFAGIQSVTVAFGALGYATLTVEIDSDPVPSICAVSGRAIY